ncbi:hypothetical protein [Actinomadura rubrobrunea]|uniref:hypothetical protein n=1 Tax=Actinomadura rubrobrunea TaxID=115335 RepID=UPI0036F2393A
MTDGGTLPAWFSMSIARLREAGASAAGVTAAPVSALPGGPRRTGGGTARHGRCAPCAVRCPESPGRGVRPRPGDFRTVE